VGLRLEYVHSKTWEWTLTPSAASPKIEFAHRTYLRRAGGSSAPASSTEVGRTLGGGIILSDQWPAPNVPTRVWVHGGSQVLPYSLSGGP
jgi:hypothetical protein